METGNIICSFVFTDVTVGLFYGTGSKALGERANNSFSFSSDTNIIGKI